MKRFMTVLLILLWLLSATACSHMDRGAQTSPTLDRIAESGTLRVGTSANMPPLNMMDKSNVPMGLDVDLANYMAGAMGVELDLVVKPFPDLLPALEAGDIDMIISGMTITPERNLKVAFAGPYHVSGKALLTKTESLVNSKNSSILNSDALAYTALESSTSATLVETIMPRARLVTVKNYEEAVDLVRNNKVDALVADYHVCLLSLLRYPDEGFVSMITPFTYEPLGIAMPAGDAHLVNWVENFINTMRASDELVKLKVKWIEDSAWLFNLK